MFYNLIYLKWWFEKSMWLIRWIKEGAKKLSPFIFTGMLVSFWLYANYPNPWIWVAAFAVHTIIGAVFHWLSDSWDAFSFLWYPLWIMYGAQVVLFLAFVKSVYDIATGFLK